jgi:hypothetical protein
MPKTATAIKKKPRAASVASIDPTRLRVVGFSGLQKKQLNVDIPVQLWDLVAAEARKGEVSKGLLISTILSQHYRKDPAKFGIVTD